jgi:NAD(P)-dependent dehydrogenase (short-subunit alcohol dehydrogenase family)
MDTVTTAGEPLTTGDKPVAVVTGANRGIGLAVVGQLAERGYATILGSRNLAAGELAAKQLGGPGLDVTAWRLDVTDQASIDGLAAELRRRYDRVDVLVNNAAIHYDTYQRAAEADLAVVAEAIETNVMGAWRMCLALRPLFRAAQHRRIVNVSSEAASLTNMGGAIPAYRISKVGLNALTRMLAAELGQEGILVNAVCPGWVATDMGGPGGRSVTEGAASVLWAVDIPDRGPTGGFFRDGRPLPW